MDNIPAREITLDRLEKMFVNISEQTDWNMTKPILWGYFFTRHEPKLLETAKTKLVKKSYRFVEIYLSDKETPSDPDMWWLHVAKEEVHTPQSQDKRLGWARKSLLTSHYQGS